MNFKPRFIEKILDGQKTRTTRLHNKYRVGEIYTVCPGRGKKGVAKIYVNRVTEIFLSDKLFSETSHLEKEGVELDFRQLFRELNRLPDDWNGIVYVIDFELKEKL